LRFDKVGCRLLEEHGYLIRSLDALCASLGISTVKSKGKRQSNIRDAELDRIADDTRAQTNTNMAYLSSGMRWTEKLSLVVGP